MSGPIVAHPMILTICGGVIFYCAQRRSCAHSFRVWLRFVRYGGVL